MRLDERDIDIIPMGVTPMESLASCLEDAAKVDIRIANDIAVTKDAMAKAATMLRDLHKFLVMVARLTPPDKREECDPEDSSEALSTLIEMARRLLSTNTDG